MHAPFKIKSRGASAAHHATHQTRTLTILKGHAWNVIEELGADRPFGDLMTSLRERCGEITSDSELVARAIFFALQHRRFGPRRTA